MSSSSDLVSLRDYAKEDANERDQREGYERKGYDEDTFNVNPQETLNGRPQESRLDGYDLEKDVANDDGSLHEAPTSYEGPLFFSPEARPRTKKALIKSGLFLIMMCCLILGIFSIYWGSMYKRNDRLRNIKSLVVIGDDGSIGDDFGSFMKTDFAHSASNWHVMSESDFMSGKSGSTEQEIHHQVHHQQWWFAFYVKANATTNLRTAIVENNQQYNVSNSLIVGFYETGRDYATLGSNIIPAIQKVSSVWTNAHAPQTMHRIANGSNSILTNYPLSPTFHDFIPLTNPVIPAPAQFGNIYIIILSFFSFSLFATVHQTVHSIHLKHTHYLIWRYVASVTAFFFIALFMGLVSLGMQIDFTPAFGKSGFLVFWMSSFMTCVAVGFMNEIVGMLCIVFFPELMGFWLLFWVVVNVAPTFTALALCPHFFRYGYALPVHNSYEITKVILFNTWKGTLGRSFGVLAAWCAVLSIVQPFVVVFFTKSMKKKAEMAKKQQEQEEKQKK